MPFVIVGDVGRAYGKEDDFDAFITAAALLRAVIEDRPLCPESLPARHAEGGILDPGRILDACPEQH